MQIDRVGNGRFALDNNRLALLLLGISSASRHGTQPAQYRVGALSSRHSKEELCHRIPQSIVKSSKSSSGHQALRLMK
jgi:hypothetical protein